MLFIETQLHDARSQASMLIQGSALAAVGSEALHRHTQRGASLAAIAVGSVGKNTAATETTAYQFGIR